MKLICFDLDNTLVHSDKAHVVAYNYGLAKLGLRKKPYKYLVKLFGKPHYEISKIIAPSLSEIDIHKLMRLHDEIVVKHTYKYIKKIKNVDKTLKELKKNYHLAILSNAVHKNIVASLKGAKLDRKLFKLIIGNDQVKHSKPWPDEILKAEHLIHHKADFMIGDSIYDVIAGKEAKVKTIAVLTGRYSKARLMKYHPDYIIKSVDEIPKLLKRINDIKK